MYIKNGALISGCLLGINCRYNGKNCLSKYIDIFLKKNNLIPVCPEQLGGLTTPRPKAEIVGGDGFDVLEGKAKVYTMEGDDITEYFIKGAKEVLNLALRFNIEIAYFKEKSPSCGVTLIYNSGELIKGVGVTTALLLKNKIKVLGVDV